jgi:hypothetical protein
MALVLAWQGAARHSSIGFGHLDLPAPDRRDERAVIGFGLVRIFAGEVRKLIARRY